MKKSAALGAGAAAFFLCHCAASAPDRGSYHRETGSYSPASRGSRTVPGERQTGEISFYGERFHGRKTASGERFDMRDFTAAHRTLPFGSRVKVTNLRNGKSVVVRVNDRGPWTRGRLLDVSLAAAKQLGMVGQGTAQAKVEVVD